MQTRDKLGRKLYHPTEDQRIERAAAQNYCCFYCGESVIGWRFVLDHVIPRSRGGNDILTNRVVACKSCDGIKANRMPTVRELGCLAVLNGVSL